MYSTNCRPQCGCKQLVILASPHPHPPEIVQQNVPRWQQMAVHGKLPCDPSLSASCVCYSSYTNI